MPNFCISRKTKSFKSEGVRYFSKLKGKSFKSEGIIYFSKLKAKNFREWIESKFSRDLFLKKQFLLAQSHQNIKRKSLLKKTSPGKKIDSNS